MFCMQLNFEGHSVLYSEAVQLEHPRMSVKMDKKAAVKRGIVIKHMKSFDIFWGRRWLVLVVM